MEAPSTAIRLNPFKGCEGPNGAPVPWSPYSRILQERPNFTRDPLLHAGCYYVQDSSAMYPGHIFRKHLSEFGPGVRVLDLCAAPGGKTTDLAASLREAFGDEFQLVSNEVMKTRAGVLRDNVARWGDPNVQVTSVDPVVFGSQMPGCFDIIVADVPCSGEGMFRKDPKAVADWSPELVEMCAARQRRILADVWPALREGGILVYSTCTYEEAENDGNLAWAAETLGGDIFAPEDEFLQYGVRLTAHGNLLKAGEVPGEGQWVGALRKSGSQAAAGGAVRGSFLRQAPCGRGSGADGSPRSGFPGLLGTDPADRVLAIDYLPEYPVVELSLQDALRYLHRDALRLPEGTPQGLIIVAFQGHPLGFAKNLGSRCNNLLPKGRRILMDV
jgi:16S rRNA C967 or C1407 C5-methylase (RsmB/RsmF family)